MPLVSTSVKAGTRAGKKFCPTSRERLKDPPSTTAASAAQPGFSHGRSAGTERKPSGT